jgi:DNA helicase-2/ATP-dependent DNA helicase PcrA
MKNLEGYTFIEWLKFDENMVFMTEAEDTDPKATDPKATNPKAKGEIATDPKAGHTLFVVQNKNTGKIYAARPFFPIGTSNVSFGEEMNNFRTGQISFVLKAEEFKKDYQIMAEKATPGNPIKFSSEMGKIFDAVTPIFNRFILPARFCRTELVPAITEKQKATDIVNIPVVDPTGYNPCQDKKEPAKPAAAGASAAVAKQPESNDKKSGDQADVKVHVNELDEDCKMKLGDPEKKFVDEAFYNVLKSGKRGNIVVNALAGSGKTSTLVCLWEKYGMYSGKRWLYLVFNKKNQLEAAERFRSVDQKELTNARGEKYIVNNDIIIKTTNKFLGDVLKQTPGYHVPRTQRSGDAFLAGQKFDDKGKPLPPRKKYEQITKIAVAQDTVEFDNLVEDSSLPKYNVVKNKLSSNGVDTRYSALGGKALSFVKRQRKAIIEASEKLANLSKQFGTDPFDNKKLEEKLDNIIDRYDISINLSRVMEGWYEIPNNRFLSTEYRNLWYHVNSFIEDISLKEKSDIIKQLTKWLLIKTAPGNKDLNDAPLKNGKNMSQMAKTELGAKMDFDKVRDFDDDYWYSGINMEKINWPKYSVVLADEIQDFNSVQKEMLKKLAEKGATIIGVGDPNQAIYRFRGAEASSFNDIVETLKKDNLSIQGTDDIIKGMPTNYRSRQAIIDYVNKATKVNNLVRGKKYEDDYHGEVTTSKSVKDMLSEIQGYIKNGELDKSTAVIARTNAPLGALMVPMLKRGIPFAAIGTDFILEIKKEMQTILDDLGIDEYYDLNSILGDSEDNQSDYDDENSGEYGTKGENSQLEKFYLNKVRQYQGIPSKQKVLKELRKNIDTMAQVIYAAMEEDDSIKNMSGVYGWLEDKFKKNIVDVKKLKKSDLKDKVILTSVHKSKGFEFGRVYLLDIENFPHAMATRDEDKEQEENAKYVAMTRAEEELHILKKNPDEKWKDI